MKQPAPKVHYVLLPLESVANQLGDVGLSGVLNSVVSYTRSLDIPDTETPPLLMVAAMALNTLRHRMHCPHINARASAISAVVQELRTVCVVWRTCRPDAKQAWLRHWMFDPVHGGQALLEGSLPEGGEEEATRLARAAWAKLKSELPLEEIPECPESFTISDAEAVAQSSETFSSALTARSLRQTAAAEEAAASAISRQKDEADARMRSLPSRSAVSPTPIAAPSMSSDASTKPTTAPPSNSSAARAKATWRRQRTASPPTSSASARSDTEALSGKSAQPETSTQPTKSQLEGGGSD